MIDDKALLEAAARAVGLRFAVNGDNLPGYIAASNEDWRYGWCYWNPLNDDAQALRLAVKLGLFTGPDFYHFRSLERFAGQDADEYTATRRAIVRAAASLGQEAKHG